MTWPRYGAALALVALVAGPAAAQTAGTSPRVVVSGGLLVTGGHSVGDRRAELRPNSSLQTPVVLFRAESRLGTHANAEARVDVRLTRHIDVFGGGTMGRPRLSVTVSADSEAGPATITESVTEYAVDGGLLWRFDWRTRPSRLQPYAVVAAGYIRHLHEERLLIEGGQTFHAGGGLFYAWRPTRRPFGVRGEIRLVRRMGGVAFDDQATTYPAISVLAFKAF